MGKETLQHKHPCSCWLSFLNRNVREQSKLCIYGIWNFLLQVENFFYSPIHQCNSQNSDLLLTCIFDKVKVCIYSIKKKILFTRPPNIKLSVYYDFFSKQGLFSSKEVFFISPNVFHSRRSQPVEILQKQNKCIYLCDIVGKRNFVLSMTANFPQQSFNL